MVQTRIEKLVPVGEKENKQFVFLPNYVVILNSCGDRATSFNKNLNTKIALITSKGRKENFNQNTVQFKFNPNIRQTIASCRVQKGSLPLSFEGISTRVLSCVHTVYRCLRNPNMILDKFRNPNDGLPKTVGTQHFQELQRRI